VLEILYLLKIVKRLKNIESVELSFLELFRSIIKRLKDSAVFTNNPEGYLHWIFAIRHFLSILQSMRILFSIFRKPLILDVCLIIFVVSFWA
jgi:hypothetical protein